jgi:spoIIIJ-associated protein
MKIEKAIKVTLEEILIKLKTEFSKIEVEEKEDNTYAVNIESSDDTATLIGHHGETIYSLQHLLKVLCWAKTKSKKEFNIVLDVDNYRKRQEENVINLAERKVDFVRKTKRAQSLPPMSGYFRRVVHLHLMDPKFDDIETESQGEGESRHTIIKLAE